LYCNLGYKGELMNDEKLVLQALQTYREARTVLNPLLSSLELLGLLRGAFASGLLALARTPVSPAQIAAAINMDEAYVIEYCHALDAHGVFVKENESYRLADKWAILTAPETPYSFQSVLDGTAARAKALEFAASNDTNFWTLMPGERMALAKGSSINPFASDSAILMKSLFRENVPDVHTILTTGGKYLELGCGVAGGLLSTLCAYPNAIAVGVEIAADLVEEARRRAVGLNINDRVVFWQGDAQHFNEREMFDYVFWSQFFFPAASRPQVLQVAFNALKPGGVLITPLQGVPSIINEHLHTEVGQGYARSRILFGSWGIPAQSSQELQLELETAGFENLRISALFNPVLVARRPLPNNP
jgi:SAM-dependent methyltransferase